MFTQEYFLHELVNNLPHAKRKGFTARIQLIVNAGVPHLEVQASFCSKKDQFTKKVGRAVAATKNSTIIKVSELGDFLNYCFESCFKQHSYWSRFSSSRANGLMRRILRDAGF